MGQLKMSVCGGSTLYWCNTFSLLLFVKYAFLINKHLHLTFLMASRTGKQTLIVSARLGEKCIIV